MKLTNPEDAYQLQNAIHRLSHIPEIKTRLTVFLYQESNCKEMEGLQNQIKALLRTKACHTQAGHSSQTGNIRQAGDVLRAGQTQARHTQARAGHHPHESIYLIAFQELNKRQTEKSRFLAMVLKRKQKSETNNDDQETDSEVSESNSSPHFRNQNPDFKTQNSGLSGLGLIQEFGVDFEANNDHETFGSDGSEDDHGEFPYQQSQLFELERQNPDFKDRFPNLTQESDEGSEANDDPETFGSYGEDEANNDEFLYCQSQMFEIE